MKIKSKVEMFKIVPAVVVLAIIIYVSIKYSPRIIEIVQYKEDFRTYLKSFGNVGSLIFVAYQMIQIIIPIIPGEFVQIAGGYIYGTFLASVLLIIGTILGSMTVFFMARIVGFPVVKLFVSKDKMDKYAFITNSSKIEIAMFVLFLIPGFPKDVLVYLAGITPINPLKFFIISIIARSPGIIGSAFIGASLLKENYTAVVIMGLISAVLFVVGMISRNKISKYIEGKL